MAVKLNINTGSKREHDTILRYLNQRHFKPTGAQSLAIANHLLVVIGLLYTETHRNYPRQP